MGGWFRAAWNRAWTLHVWGFHEEKFDPEDVRTRLSTSRKLFRGSEDCGEEAILPEEAWSWHWKRALFLDNFGWF
jgi:hypothetical protein